MRYHFIVSGFGHFIAIADFNSFFDTHKTGGTGIF